MTYTAPAAETTVKADDLAIQDKAGNNAVALTDKAVTNLVPATEEAGGGDVPVYATISTITPGTAVLAVQLTEANGVKASLYNGATEVVSQTFSSTMALIEVTAQASVTNTTLRVTSTTGDATAPAVPVVTLGTTGDDTITVGDFNYIFTFGGSDTLKFTADALSGESKFSDYSVADDSIQLSKTAFTALGSVGALTTAEFESGAGLTAAVTAEGRIVYNTTNGALYYDADGSGATAAVLIGTFGTSTARPELVVGEFAIIA